MNVLLTGGFATFYVKHHVASTYFNKDYIMNVDRVISYYENFLICGERDLEAAEFNIH